MTKMLYQIKDWQLFYENAKSRSIQKCSFCGIPNKQDGLGYNRILAEKDGPALYGCFVATVLMASKQPIPRQGYLTDTGSIDGIPLTAADIALKTRMPEKAVEKMLDITTLPTICWIVTYEWKDTSWSPSIQIREGREGKKEEYISPEPAKADSRPVLVIPLIKRDGEFKITQEMVDEWRKSFPGVDVMQTLRIIRQWNIDNPSRRKTKSGIRSHISRWLGKEQNKAIGQTQPARRVGGLTERERCEKSARDMERQTGAPS